MTSGLQQATVVVAEQDPSQALARLALFMPDGSSVDLSNLGGGGGGPEGVTPALLSFTEHPNGSQLYYYGDHTLVLCGGGWPWQPLSFGYTALENSWVALNGFNVTIEDTDHSDGLHLIYFPTDEEVWYSAANGEHGEAGTVVDGSMTMVIDPGELATIMSTPYNSILAGVLELVTGRTFDGEDIDEWGTTVGRLLYWQDETGAFEYARSQSTFLAVIEGMPQLGTFPELGYVQYSGGYWQTASQKAAGIGYNAGTTADRYSAYIGHQYFDTDLGQPIWWNGSDWVDNSGTPVA